MFELDNVMVWTLLFDFSKHLRLQINTQIVQNYADNPGKVEKVDNSTDLSSSCQNYSIHEMVLAAGENNSDVFSLFPFGINRTQLPQTTVFAL